MNECDYNGWTPLHVCSKFNRIDIAEVLVNAGASIVAKEEMGKTPIAIAENFDYTKLASFLKRSLALRRK